MSFYQSENSEFFFEISNSGTSRAIRTECWVQTLDQAGFQCDASSPASDWSRAMRRSFDWLTSPSSEHQNANPYQRKTELEPKVYG